jgi:hypothetical protein
MYWDNETWHQANKINNIYIKNNNKAAMKQVW